MRWREFQLVALAIASLVLMNCRGSEPPAGAMQASAGSQKPEATGRALGEPAAGADGLAEDPVAEESEPPFAPLEGIIVAYQLLGTPALAQGRIRNNPAVARAVERRIISSHEIEMAGVRRALDILAVDQAVREDILVQTDQSRDALIAVRMAEARGDITFLEYWEALTRLTPAAIAGRYLSTPQMRQFADFMGSDLLPRYEARDRDSDAALADMRTRMSIEGSRIQIR